MEPNQENLKQHRDRQNTERLHMRLSVADLKLLEYLAEFYTTTRSDVIRTAIRSFAGQTARLEKKMSKDG